MAYNFKVGDAIDSLSLAAFLHQFEADFGSADYGDEINVQLAAKISRVTLTLKYASYEAETLSVDTDKMWLSMDYAF